MKIGIPRAFLYYKYGAMWTAFFRALGADVVLSKKTTKETLNRGAMLSIDETCLSSKVFMGHVESLIGECDRIFVPRIAGFGKDGIMCTKFEALYDLVQNTFRDRSPRLIDFDIDPAKGKSELSAYMQLGRKLGATRASSFRAYLSAKQSYAEKRSDIARAMRDKLSGGGIKVLIVGHPYVVYDEYIGGPVIDYMRSLGATPVLACEADEDLSADKYTEITDSLPWMMSRQLVGAVAMYRDMVDGIVLMSAFPCGPDSLVNEILVRRVHGLPMLTLTMDVQDGEAGVETRLESFIDIINMKREARNG